MANIVNRDALQSSLRMLDKMGAMTISTVREKDPEAAKRLEKLDDLLKREGFAEEFINCADKEAAVRLFADNGFEITEKEIEGIVAQVNSIAQLLVRNNGELSEDELEGVAGGGWLWGIIGGIAGGSFFGSIGAAIGTIICPGIGTVIGGIIGAAGGGAGVGVCFGTGS